MHDSSYPSVWGSHPEAIFYPLVVCNKLVTSIERAPAEWKNRLEELGFTKGSCAWLRMGATAPSEYDYLSPAILLKSFKHDDIFSACEDNGPSTVPLNIQDAIVDLWKSNLDGLLFELSLLGVETQAGAWTYVEAAIEGHSAAETDAITCLAITRMNHLGVLTGAAREYAIQRGCLGAPPDRVGARGRVLARSGEFVQWTGVSEDFVKGRLAMTLRQSDPDAWVFRDGPRYVGGVTVPELVKVARDQILSVETDEPVIKLKPSSLGSISSYCKADLPESENIEIPVAFSLLSYTEETGVAVKQILSEAIFPSKWWRDALQNRMFEQSEGDALGVEILEALERIEHDLNILSRHYYGSTGVGFCLTSQIGCEGSSASIWMKLGNYDTEGYYSICDGVEGLKVLVADHIDYADTTVKLDAQHRENVQRFKNEAGALGGVVGADLAVPVGFLETFRIKRALRNLERSGAGKSLSLDQLTSILSAVSGRYFLIRHIAEPDDGFNGNTCSISAMSVFDNAEEAPKSLAYLAVSNIRQSIRTLPEVLENIQRSETKNDVESIVTYSIASVYARHHSGLAMSLAKQIDGISCFSNQLQDIRPLTDSKAAKEALSALIGSLDRHVANDDDRRTLAAAWEKLNEIPYFRAKPAPVVIKAKNFHGLPIAVDSGELSKLSHERFFVASPKRKDIRTVSALSGTNGFSLSGVRSRSHAKRSARQGVLVSDCANYRCDIPVIVDDFMKTFAFSSFSCGDWQTPGEDQATLNRAYDAMMTFTKLVGWEPIALSLGGRLGLAAGTFMQGMNHSRNLAADGAAVSATFPGSLARSYWRALGQHFHRGLNGHSTDQVVNDRSDLRDEVEASFTRGSANRGPIGKALFNLQVAIMRDVKPGGDPDIIDHYTEPSEIVVRSLSEGSESEASSEIFAAAMEAWLIGQMNRQGVRDDYLACVDPAMICSLSPDHLDRINRWAPAFIESIGHAVHKLAHPVLVDGQIPVFRSGNRALRRLQKQDLLGLVKTEFDRMFRRSTFNLGISNLGKAKVEFYSALKELVMLRCNQPASDIFDKDAWIVCHSGALNPAERAKIRNLFATDESLVFLVREELRSQGKSDAYAAAISCDHLELQATAYKLWVSGDLDLSAKRISEFYYVREIVDLIDYLISLFGCESSTEALEMIEQEGMQLRGDELDVNLGVTIHLPTFV